eukprot:6741970-Pyramimonas_sp.AAC.1
MRVEPLWGIPCVNHVFVGWCLGRLLLGQDIRGSRGGPEGVQRGSRGGLLLIERALRTLLFASLPAPDAKGTPTLPASGARSSRKTSQGGHAQQRARYTLRLYWTPASP